LDPVHQLLGGGIRRLEIQGAANLLARWVKAVQAQEGIGEQKVRARAILDAQSRFPFCGGIPVLAFCFEHLAQRQVRGIGFRVERHRLHELALGFGRPAPGLKLLPAVQMSEGALLRRQTGHRNFS